MRSFLLLWSLLVGATSLSLHASAKESVIVGASSKSPTIDNIARSKFFEEPLLWTGSVEPTESESIDLWRALEVSSNDSKKATQQFEAYLTKFPHSPWSGSLRANLAQFYRETGRYSLALGHWKVSGTDIGKASGENETRIADYALVSWVNLLSSLGRTEELEKIFEATRGRAMKNLVWQKRYNDTFEGLSIMKNKPGIAYKCGTFALAQIGNRMGRLSQTNAHKLLSIPSPETGFSLTTLTELSEQYGLNLKPVYRSTGEEIVVPSVIHWKQDHYAAIVAQKKDFYRVLDPTFGTDKWIKADVINAEASGNFMIPVTNSISGWVTLATVETDRIYGKGYPNTKEPPAPPCPPDTCCPPGSPGPSGPSGPGGGRPGSGCTSCDTGSLFASVGMASWVVSEPFIELSVNDTPLSYKASRGPSVDLIVNFHQNETRPQNTTNFSFGPFWNCNWLTYLDVTDDLNNLSFEDYRAVLFAPNGGESRYSAEFPDPNSRDHSTLERILSGTNLTGFLISYPNGSKAEYGLITTLSTGIHKKRVFLTQKITPEGYNNLFQYSTNGGVLLTNLVDVDQRNTVIVYDTNFPSQISRVISPYTNQARFYYNSTNGILTNIVDPVGISSQFVYTWSNNIPLMTSLATPYGVTSFEYFGPGVTSTNLGANVMEDDINVALQVTESTSGRHLYMYRDISDEEPVAGYIESIRRGNTPYYDSAQYEELLDTVNLHYRNSFYWGPRQRQEVPEDFTTFTSSDYAKARVRRWLHGAKDSAIIHGPGGSFDYYTVSQTLAMEREPSPDGSTEGKVTWYGYTGKPDDYPSAEGTNSWPSLVLYTFDNLQDPYAGQQSNMHLDYKDYNRLGRVIKSIESYTLGAGADLRTNVFQYDVNEVDLIAHLLIVNDVPILQQSNIYNSFHQVITNYDALLQVTSYTYDSERRVTSVKRPSGLTTTNFYSASGELERTIDIEIGRTNSYFYENGEIKRHTNELGLVEVYHRDALRRLTGITSPNGSITNLFTIASPLTGGTGTNLLDITATRDKMTNWTYFVFNGVRQRIAITNALASVTLYDFCPCGSLNSIRDALTNYTYFYYDFSGRLTNTVYADGFAVTNYYNSSGHLTNTVDSGGVSVTNFFNNQGMLALSSNAVGQVFSRAYDIEDHLTGSTDANGVSTIMSYDELGRMLTRSYPDNGIERFGYSARGLTAYTNQLTTNITRYAYNEAGWKTFETNANLEVTQFKYDSSGNLTNLLDGKTQSMKWFYDQFGRVTNKVDNLGTNMFIYGYNANSWLTNRWTPQKANAYYTYDKVGNLTNVVYASSPALQFKYDAMNRLTNMADAIGTTKFGYTATGLLASEDGPWANDTASYSYTNRMRSGMSILAPSSSAWSQTYGYDAANRLANIASPAGSFGYTYQPSLDGVTTASGLIKQLALPNGANITNDFDNSARMLGTYLRNSTDSLLNKHEYIYNTGNQRTKQTRTTNDYVDYTYDPIGQLKTATGKESGGVTNRLQEQLGYAYDAAGNLSGRTNNNFLQNFNVNSLNELTTVTRNGTDRLTVAGTTTSSATNVTVNTSNAVLYLDRTFASTNHGLVNGNNSFTAIAKDSLGRRDTNSITGYLPTNAVYAYDLNGNLTNDSAKVFEYDDENQLTRVTKTTEFKKEYIYDGKMRLRVRKEFAWRGGVWTKTNEIRFIWDGDVIVQQRDANNLPTLTFTRGTDLSGSLQGAGGIGGLLAYTDSRLVTPASFYYHADGNGNITALIDDRQQIAARYLYDSFGIPLSASGSQAFVNPIWFSSQFYDGDTGFLHYKYRIYIPQIQRWLNRDPLGELGFELVRAKNRRIDGDISNGYEFNANNALTRIDILGLKIYKCARQAKTMSNNLHAYLWDDKNKKSCGRTGKGTKKDPARGEDAGDTGPGPGNQCEEIPDSDGKEDSVMACCMRKDSSSMWKPFINDCHNWADDCLKKNGLDDPPMNRFNDRFWETYAESLTDANMAMH